MPATIYNPPSTIPGPPDFHDAPRDESGKVDLDALLRMEDEWRQTLKDWCARFGKGDYAGASWHYPVGDGAAEYVILSLRPLALVHVPLGDAWRIPDVVARGLTAADLRAYVDAPRLFGEAR